MKTAHFNSLLRQIGAALLLLVVTATGAEAGPRNFVGYYPSWLSAETKPLAATSPVYSHVVIAFARPDFSWNGHSWNGTGLQFAQPPNVIRVQIRDLQTRGTHVLLAVGGATYLNWRALAAEKEKPGPITAALIRFVNDMGLDGIDVDYERDSTAPEAIAQYRAAIAALRKVANGKLLSLAAWSTGADCTAETGNAACGGKFSDAGGSAGRERLVFQDKHILGKIDLVNVMSYDAGFANFDPVRSWALYRGLFPADVTVNIGFENAPEGWGGATLVASDPAAICKSAQVAADQFGSAVGRPYSIPRSLQDGPLTSRPTSNAADGAMLWHIVKDQKLPRCGPRTAASPQDLEALARTLLGR
jgi:hypothetical protein